eukprot:795548-Lingulodinium_polyedra.AAC.1
MHSSASSKSSSAGSWSRIGASAPVGGRSGAAWPAEAPACPGRHLSRTQVLTERSKARALLACLPVPVCPS